MKTILPLILLSASAVLIFFLSCRRGEEKNPGTVTSSAATNTDTAAPDHRPDLSQGLRSMVLQMTPEQLGLKLPADQTIAYGVIMDWGRRSATVTLTSFQTGDASLYFSSGGSVIGGGQYPIVQQAAKRFVAVGQDYLGKAIKTADTSLPREDQLKFYLLTNHGLFGLQDSMEEIDRGASPILRLYRAGDNVITTLRIASEVLEKNAGQDNQRRSDHIARSANVMPQQPATIDANIAKVYVTEDEKMFVNGNETSLGELEALLKKLPANGMVYYARANGMQTLSTTAMKAIDVIGQRGLPIQFYTDGTFTTVVQLKH